MTDEQARTAPAPACELTVTQHSRITFARRDLDDARATDLAQTPPASLILLVERLRRRLDDMLLVIGELTEHSPPPPE